MGRNYSLSDHIHSEHSYGGRSGSGRRDEVNEDLHFPRTPVFPQLKFVTSLRHPARIKLSLLVSILLVRFLGEVHQSTFEET